MKDSNREISVQDYRDYYNLGWYKWQISTDNPDAQSWFYCGLVWSYGFNHEESAICFQRAIESDPGCAIAYWGLAYALGPNYNKPWEAFEEAELGTVVERTHAAVVKAREYSNAASDVEKALIEALSFRYPDGQRRGSKDFSIWNEDYAHNMRMVYERFPDNLDVAALYADSLMNLKPWALWDVKTGEPLPDAPTLQVKGVLEKAIDQRYGVDHPGLLHLYIHLMELSGVPEVAIPASGHLQDLVPDAGHLCHMPSHIYVLCGDYKRAIDSNTAAVKVDQKFLDRSGNLNFYTLYRCHNAHFLIYAAMFAGRKNVTLKAIDELEPTIPEALLRVESPPMADWLESFISIRVHIFIRFGMWDDILKLVPPADSDLYCVTTAMYHYGKGVAHAAKGDISSAEQERALFTESLKQVKPSRTLFNNKCTDILAVAQEMLDGELEYRKNNIEVAFEHLRSAIMLEDNLPYDEPWGWMQPVRHALGALSVEQGRVEEAAAIYKADLGLDDTLPRAQRHPNNVWALHGYHECLVRLGKADEAEKIKALLDKALVGVDVPIVSSCFCRLRTEDTKCCD